ncbi:MAG: carboxymuconolactone decarboxylase [Balneolaceae bacterium]|nr:MAG: carboxymuconolactone decarboxylase [Balneolaceae bacterium]
MSYITLNNNLPGIVGLMAYRPETAKPLNELAEILLRGESTLTSAEREMIASYVSYQNECHFCHSSHGAAAAHHLDGNLDLLDDIKAGFKKIDISPKLRALLNIAKKVQILGNKVTGADIKAARNEGATDREIHDTVLIAAAFCMYNRYVDGLGTWAPEEKEAYDETGRMLAHEGYTRNKFTG